MSLIYERIEVIFCNLISTSNLCTYENIHWLKHLKDHPDCGHTDVQFEYVQL